MLDALAEFFPPEAEWTRPGGGLFMWATLPDFIDTHDLLAKALREEQVAFVPGAAAYVDGRGGNSMRLNFSGADADDPRGVRRIGKVVREQVELYGTFVGRPAAKPPGEEPRETPAARERSEQLADVVRPARSSRAGQAVGAQPTRR